MNKYQNEEVISKLPCAFGRNEPVPASLIGAKIVNVGTFKNSGLVEGGGLVIEFLIEGERDSDSIVLAFDETAIWVDHSSVGAAQGK